MNALDFISKAIKAKPLPLYALVGPEAFLRRQSLEKLTADLLGDADPAFALSTYEGETANWSTVKSELDTLPFLSPRRVVVIEQADPFVTNNRGVLEKYAEGADSRGTLILEVKSWPPTTRLAKLVPESATIKCEASKPAALVAWAKKWLPQRYGKQFAPEAAEWLVELGGDSMGLLDGEMAKLAAFVGDEPRVNRAHVEAAVGRSRAAETFKIFDALGAGDAAKALAIFDRLMEAGEEPMKVLGAFSYQLRRLAAVSRLHRAGMSDRDALFEAGVKWDSAQAAVLQQLRRLGKARMDRVYDWLLEADLGMKGQSILPERVQLEKLLVRLARPSASPMRK